MSDRVICIIQARQGSSRLPGKSLRVLAGRPLIAHVIERALAMGTDGVVVATSTNHIDDLLVDAAGLCGVPVVRGSEQDVLGRMAGAAALTKADVVVRVTGDCPLLCPDVGRIVMAAFYAAPQEYVWNNTSCSGYPDGTDVECFTRRVLELAATHAKKPEDREHVTTWIRRHCSTSWVGSSVDWSSHKWSVDTQADFDRVSAIYRHLPRGRLTLRDTLEAELLGSQQRRDK